MENTTKKNKFQANLDLITEKETLSIKENQKNLIIYDHLTCSNKDSNNFLIEYPKKVTTLKSQDKKPQIPLSKIIKPYNFENIKKLELLGSGGFGDVFKAYHKITGDFLAIKFYKNKPELSFEDIELEDELMRSVEAINNKNYFLKYEGLFKGEKQSNSYVIVMESGVINLAEVLKMRKSYEYKECLYIFKKLVHQLLILEESGIVNRDIKTENVILVEDKANPSFFIYKISDFGIGCKLPKGKKTMNIDELGGFSKKWCSPEVRSIYQGGYGENFYDPFISDVYSLGLVVLDLLGYSYQDFKKNGIKEKAIEPIIKKMLKKNPKKRAQFYEVEQYLKYLKDERPKNEKKFITLYNEFKEKGEKPEKRFKNKLDNFSAYLSIYQIENANDFLEECSKIIDTEGKDIVNTILEVDYLIAKGKICQKEYFSKLKEAIKCHEKAKILSEKIYGEFHSETAKICVMLADDYFDVDKFEDSEKYCNLAKNIYMSLKNVEDYGLELELIFRRVLNICCLSKFNFNKLVKYVKEWVNSHEEYYGKKGQTPGIFIEGLKAMCGFIDIFQIKTIDIQTIQLITSSYQNFLKNMLRTYEEIKNNDILHQIEYCKWNGFINIILGDYTECEVALNHMIEYCQDFYGIKHIFVANFYQRTALFAWRFQNDINKAQIYFEKAFELKKTMIKVNELELMDLNFDYAEFLKYGKNDENEAEKYYEKVMEVLEDNEEIYQLVIDSFGGNINYDAIIPRTICKIFR